MREIKFRGKSTMPIDYLDMIGVEHTNGWMFDNLITNNGKPFIVGNIEEVTDEYINPTTWTSVHLESVGQLTGLKDKNGREIYEGDVIRYTKVFYTDCSREEIEDVSEPVIGSFYYAEDLYPGLQFEDGTGSLFWPGTIDSGEFEIIGNLYDNPELMEVAE